jgi:hypothetical protein
MQASVQCGAGGFQEMLFQWSIGQCSRVQKSAARRDHAFTVRFLPPGIDLTRLVFIGLPTPRDFNIWSVLMWLNLVGKLMASPSRQVQQRTDRR